mgnify:CR=1 FL=1
MVGSWGPARHHSPVDDELAILVGVTLSGRYRIDALVAKGGLGFVLAATDVELRRSVAIKFLRPEARRRPEVVSRFSREARSAARLSGEHVARVFDVGEHEGSPFIVLEYLEGRDLESELRKRQSFPIAEAVGYVLQALDGLAEAHAIGVIHRDLKPPNLFLADVRGKRVLKILDVGISKAPSPGESDLTAAKMIMGTPTYMSPEQIQSTAGVDARTDVWSIGVVLYELLTKTLPFVGESTSAILLSVTMREPTPVHALRPEVPPGLSAVVMRCLAKDPDARFADVGELAAALAPWAPAGSGRSLARIARTLSVRSLRTVSPPASQAPVPPAVSTLPFIERSSPPPYPANGRSSPSPPPASRAPRARGSWASRIVAGSWRSGARSSARWWFSFSSRPRRRRPWRLPSRDSRLRRRCSSRSTFAFRVDVVVVARVRFASCRRRRYWPRRSPRVRRMTSSAACASWKRRSTTTPLGRFAAPTRARATHGFSGSSRIATSSADASVSSSRSAQRRPERVQGK